MAFTRVAALLHAALSDVSATQHHTATVETVHPDPSVDNEIARYDGIVGALQGYTSDAPTLSDVGVLTLPGGSIVFPSTQVPNADPNALDEYEEGTFTPTLMDDSNDGTGESQVYGAQDGLYTRLGRVVVCEIRLTTSSIGSLNGGQGAQIGGLPFAPGAVAGGGGCGESSGLGLTAGFNLSWHVQSGVARVGVRTWDGVAGTSPLTITEWSADGSCICTVIYSI